MPPPQNVDSASSQKSQSSPVWPHSWPPRRPPWPEQKARDWYARQPWLVGANYIPANAINELEMWQAGTFDPIEIDKELGWAEGIGMHTSRVFARPSLGAGLRRLQRTHRPIPPHRGQAQDPSRAGAVRFLLDPNPHSGNNPRPGLAFTIPAGCKVRERRRWPIPLSTRGSQHT